MREMHRKEHLSGGILDQKTCCLDCIGGILGSVSGVGG